MREIAQHDRYRSLAVRSILINLNNTLKYKNKITKIHGIELAINLLIKNGFQGIAMTLRKCIVVNANYDRVLIVMDKFLTDQYDNVCTCTRCYSDIAAIALNYLPPHYIVDGNNGQEYGSPWVMVETAVRDAIDRVVEHPNHPVYEPRRERL